MRRASANALTVGQTLAVYLLWIFLCALGAWVAWQFHATVIVFFTLWIQGDLPRPIGWTAATLVGISRASLLVNGALWLMWIMYMETVLRRSAQRRRLIARCLQIFAVYAAILVASYATIALIG